MAGECLPLGLASGSKDGTIRVWNPGTGVRVARLPSLQYGELVAQDQDLCGLPCLLTPG